MFRAVVGSGSGGSGFGAAAAPAPAPLPPAQIYELESQYLMAEFTQLGTVLKGGLADGRGRAWSTRACPTPPSAHHLPPPHLPGLDGFLSTKESLRKRAQRAYRVEDRLFSLSSTASPAVLGRGWGTEGGGWGTKGGWVTEEGRVVGA